MGPRRRIVRRNTAAPLAPGLTLNVVPKPRLKPLVPLKARSVWGADSPPIKVLKKRLRTKRLPIKK